MKKIFVLLVFIFSFLAGLDYYIYYDKIKSISILDKNINNIQQKIDKVSQPTLNFLTGKYNKKILTQEERAIVNKLQKEKGELVAAKIESYNNTNIFLAVFYVLCCVSATLIILLLLRLLSSFLKLDKSPSQRFGVVCFVISLIVFISAIILKLSIGNIHSEIYSIKTSYGILFWIALFILIIALSFMTGIIQKIINWVKIGKKTS